MVEEDGRCVRCDGVEGVREFVQGAQQYAMTLHYLKRYSFSDRDSVAYGTEHVRT